MANLPTCYFQDAPADVMHEIMDGMLQPSPESIWKEIDDWANCPNVKTTIEEWHDRVAEFKCAR